jgi:hypothetical protein
MKHIFRAMLQITDIVTAQHFEVKSGQFNVVETLVSGNNAQKLFISLCNSQFNI